MFRVPVPKGMVGRTLAQCRFRQTTGCNVVAIEKDGQSTRRPSPSSVLTEDSQLVIVADAESEKNIL